MHGVILYVRAAAQFNSSFQTCCLFWFHTSLPQSLWAYTSTSHMAWSFLLLLIFSSIFALIENYDRIRDESHFLIARLTNADIRLVVHQQHMYVCFVCCAMCVWSVQLQTGYKVHCSHNDHSQYVNCPYPFIRTILLLCSSTRAHVHSFLVSIRLVACQTQPTTNIKAPRSTLHIHTYTKNTAYLILRYSFRYTTYTALCMCLHKQTYILIYVNDTFIYYDMAIFSSIHSNLTDISYTSIYKFPWSRPSWKRRRRRCRGHWPCSVFHLQFISSIILFLCRYNTSI